MSQSGDRWHLDESRFARWLREATQRERSELAQDLLKDLKDSQMCPLTRIGTAVLWDKKRGQSDEGLRVTVSRWMHGKQSISRRHLWALRDYWVRKYTLRDSQALRKPAYILVSCFFNRAIDIQETSRRLRLLMKTRRWNAHRLARKTKWLARKSGIRELELTSNHIEWLAYPWTRDEALSWHNAWQRVCEMMRGLGSRLIADGMEGLSWPCADERVPLPWMTESIGGQVFPRMSYDRWLALARALNCPLGDLIRISASGEPALLDDRGQFQKLKEPETIKPRFSHLQSWFQAMAPELPQDIKESVSIKGVEEWGEKVERWGEYDQVAAEVRLRLGDLFDELHPVRQFTTGPSVAPPSAEDAYVHAHGELGRRGIELRDCGIDSARDVKEREEAAREVDEIDQRLGPQQWSLLKEYEQTIGASHQRKLDRMAANHGMERGEMKALYEKEKRAVADHYASLGAALQGTHRRSALRGAFVGDDRYKAGENKKNRYQERKNENGNDESTSGLNNAEAEREKQEARLHFTMNAILTPDEKEIVWHHAALGNLSDQKKFEKIATERSEKPDGVRGTHERAVKKLKEAYAEKASD